MIPAMIEKAGFGIAVVLLFALNRVSLPMLGAGLVDLILWRPLCYCIYADAGSKKDRRITRHTSINYQTLRSLTLLDYMHVLAEISKHKSHPLFGVHIVIPKHGPSSFYLRLHYRNVTAHLQQVYDFLTGKG